MCSAVLSAEGAEEGVACAIAGGADGACGGACGGACVCLFWNFCPENVLEFVWPRVVVRLFLFFVFLLFVHVEWLAVWSHVCGVLRSIPSLPGLRLLVVVLGVRRWWWRSLVVLVLLVLLVLLHHPLNFHLGQNCLLRC